jgi:hypothetical protein
VLRIEAHSGYRPVPAAGYAHKAAGIVADAADKPAVAAKAGDTYRHVGRRAAGTLQQATFAFRQQVHYRIPRTQTFAFILFPPQC